MNLAEEVSSSQLGRKEYAINLNELFGLNQDRKIQKMARCVQKKTSIRKNVVSLQNKKENNNTKQ